jgi:hypothetical protein
MASRAAVVKWLLDGDAAIRWQVMRDLTDAPADAVVAERSRVANEGWGAELLGRQTAEGHWNDATEHGWMTTTDALQLLRDLGADPSDAKVRGAVGRVTERITWWQLDGRPFFDGETEACINGRILATGAYFGAPVEPLLGRLLGEQLEDGGWNCEAPASKRSSFHSTICVLEGLLEYEKAHGPSAAVTDARSRAEHYLLERRMLRSLSSGEIINRRWTSFLFPPVWQYDVLRGLDYLRSAGVKPDERVAEAVALVEQKRGGDGRWLLDGIHPDHANRLAFDVETEVGHASRWNTLRALRVLDWASG